MSVVKSDKDAIAKIEENREAIEYLAEHGEHLDTVAKALREVLEDGK